MISTSEVLSQLFSGLSYGMVLMLIALGLTLIFGVMGLINFAHGELYALGAYMGFVTVQTTGSFWLALVVAPICVGIVGIVMERYLLSQLYDSDPLFVLLLTFGLALVMQELIRLIWGSGLQPLSAPSMFDGFVQVAGVFMPFYWLFIIGFTLLVTGLVILVLNKTKYGMYVRAASRDSEMVSLLGIDNTKVYTGLFAAGAALAGLSGVLYAARNVYIDPDVFALWFATLPVIWVSVGGRESLLGAVVATIGIEYFRLSIEGEMALVVLGAMLVVFIVALPGGVVPWIADRLDRSPSGQPQADREPDVDGPEAPAEVTDS